MPRRPDPAQADLFSSATPAEPPSPPLKGVPGDPLLRRRLETSGDTGRRGFAVGRSGRGRRELHLVHARGTPLPGPWIVTAVVSGS